MNSIIEKLKKCDCVEKLNEIGTVENILEAINEEISPLIVNASTYQEIYKALDKLAGHWDTFQCDDYFKNERLKYIFALIYMEGKRRNEIIDLTDDLYENEDKAKKWYRGVVKKIHPDLNMDLQVQAENAMRELEILYSRIKKCFEEEDV